jgi:mannan endo-1,6-alpha-mannosidase
MTAQLVPSLADQIWPYIKASGVAAAAQCSGGADGNTCGMKWTQQAVWDGSSGVGQQMSALSAVGANMIRVGGLKAPFTRDTGGESVGDPNAGTDADVPAGGEENHVLTDPITMGDKAGAGILTALVLSFTLGGGWFLLAG